MLLTCALLPLYLLPKASQEALPRGTAIGRGAAEEREAGPSPRPTLPVQLLPHVHPGLSVQEGSAALQPKGLPWNVSWVASIRPVCYSPSSRQLLHVAVNNGAVSFATAHRHIEVLL